MIRSTPHLNDRCVRSGSARRTRSPLALSVQPPAFMPLYVSYGLHIDSEIPIPEFVDSMHRSPDVLICYGRVDANRLSVANDRTFSWPTVGSFRVRNGVEITADLNDDVDPDLARLPLQGAVLAELLRQRGYVVLHASAVVVGGQAVAFVGHKGFGKSTTAGALLARGHRLITDDLLAVDVGGPAPRVHSGFPMLKLWPDAVAHLGGDPNTLPLLHRSVAKRSQVLDVQNDPRTAYPLARIVVLDRGDALDLRPISTRDAFVEAIRFSYAVEPIKEEAGTSHAAHVRRYSELARNVPMRRLVRTNDASALPQIARLIEHDLVPDLAAPLLPPRMRPSGPSSNAAAPAVRSS